MSKRTKNRIPEVGERFGYLTVQGYSPNRASNGQFQLLLLCDCGATNEVTLGNLPRTRSCGCKGLFPGRVIGTFTLISKVREAVHTTSSRWKITCNACGKTKESSVGNIPRSVCCSLGEDRERVRTIRRKGWLKTKYGLTQEALNILWNHQQGLCALCGGPLGDILARYSIDHCHETRQVLGLLHEYCNMKKGAIGDTLEQAQRNFEKVVSYLKSPPAKEAGVVANVVMYGKNKNRNPDIGEFRADVKSPDKVKRVKVWNDSSKRFK